MRKMMMSVAAMLLLTAPCGFCDELESALVSTQALLGLLKDAYAEMAGIDDDGDLRIDAGGIKIYVEVDEREFIKVYSIWRKAESISDNRLFRILNAWNREKIFATASSMGDRIYLEYFLCTEGGINAKNFNGTLEWLFSVADKFNRYLADEDAI